MADISTSLEQATSRAGLQPAREHPSVIGERAGFAVQLARVVLEDNKPSVLFAARIDPTTATALRAALTQDAKRLVAIPVFPGSVRLDGGVLLYPFPPASLAKLDGRYLDVVDALLGVAATVGPPPPLQCRVCGSDHGAAPRVVWGLVDRLCRSCEAKLVEAARREKAAHDALPVRWGRALAAGAAASMLGAIVWLGVILALGIQHGAVAAGIGLGIGLATRYAAGKRSPIVDVITAVGAVASTAGALLLLFALGALADPATTFVALVSDGVGDLAFAGFAGLLGGLGAVRLSDGILNEKKRI